MSVSQAQSRISKSGGGKKTGPNKMFLSLRKLLVVERKTAKMLHVLEFVKQISILLMSLHIFLLGLSLVKFVCLQHKSFFFKV